MRKASVLIDQSLKDVRLGSPYPMGIIVSGGEGSLASCWTLAPDVAVPVVQLSTGQIF